MPFNYSIIYCDYISFKKYDLSCKIVYKISEIKNLNRDPELHQILMSLALAARSFWYASA